MKRSNFLKLVATMVVAPTLMGETVIEPTKDNQEQSSFEGDRIRVYTKQANECRLNDIIISDMNYAAIIVSINLAGNPFIEARPIKMGEYKYKDLTKFEVMSKQFGEYSDKKIETH